MEPVIAPFVPDIGYQQNKKGEPDGQSGDIDEAVNPVLFNISRCDFQVIDNQNRGPPKF